MASGLLLPRFFSLKSKANGKYLTLTMKNNVPSLSFSGDGKSLRLATHEVFYNSNEISAMIRCANGRYWRRDGDKILADKEDIPDPSDKSCHFKVVRVGSKEVLLQSAADDERWLAESSGELVLSSKDGNNTLLQLQDARDSAIVFPSFVSFKGDNGKFLRIYWNEEKDWLQFSASDEDLVACFKVWYLENGNVAVQSVKSSRYWRRDPNWIKVDVDDISQVIKDDNCQFEPVRLSTTMVALRCVANQSFVKRLSDYWDDMLNAATDSTNDTTTHLIVGDPVKKKSIFNVKYLVHLAEVEVMEPLLVGKGSMVNSSSRPADLVVQVQFTRNVVESHSWTTSDTFSVSRTVTISTGIPDVVGVEGSISIGYEHTFATEVGSSIETAVQLKSSYQVKNVPPGKEATVIVEVTQAKCSIPFTYEITGTRVDGVEVQKEQRVDGMFRSVTSVYIRGEVIETEKKQVLPVHLARNAGRPFGVGGLVKNVEAGVEGILDGTAELVTAPLELLGGLA